MNHFIHQKNRQWFCFISFFFKAFAWKVDYLIILRMEFGDQLYFLFLLKHIIKGSLTANYIIIRYARAFEQKGKIIIATW